MGQSVPGRFNRSGTDYPASRLGQRAAGGFAHRSKSTGSSTGGHAFRGTVLTEAPYRRLSEMNTRYRL
jgi:hypothetical protein